MVEKKEFRMTSKSLGFAVGQLLGPFTRSGDAGQTGDGYASAQLKIG